MKKRELEAYFEPFRKNIVGHNATYNSPYGKQRIIYADWIAGGRLYAPIEDKIKNEFGPYVANTHTEASETGTRMTKAYKLAHQLIKKHVNAGTDDVIITAGFGLTTVINKFQRILGLKTCGELYKTGCIQKRERPVVFITHMEHHSNHTSWYETNVDVEIIQPDDELFVDLNDLKKKLEKYKNREFKIGSFTACSNVTGIQTQYYKLARLMHEYGGLCFIDFAASAPYVDIDMHPEDPMEKLDAIMFSPHKFLGGPGSSGVLIFDKSMYKQSVPDHPGGGTVDWTNPWGEHKYFDDIEVREDGGTPGFLQAIRIALVIELKNSMGVEKILAREKELIEKLFLGLKNIKGINIFAQNIEDRIGVVSFYADDIHYNLFVKLLSDRFGIQVRGGCVCAGTYGHFLLNIDREYSKNITDQISSGNLSEKPGWVRLSLHPTMTDGDIDNIINAISEIMKSYKTWEKDYKYCQSTNEFQHISYKSDIDIEINDWFKL